MLGPHRTLEGRGRAVTIDYDQDDDTLYVRFSSDPQKALHTETPRGDVLRISEETGRILGVTILFFMERIERGEEIEIPEVGAVGFSSGFVSSLRGEHRKYHQ